MRREHTKPTYPMPNGPKTLLRRAEVETPRLKHLWLDSAYRGEDKGKDWVEKALGWGEEPVEPPRRWVVERTFSWTDQNRRMSKDYERLTETSEAFIYVAMSRLMARRLARS
jgi:putative transposase